MPNTKREDVDAITDYFNINAGNPVQCLTQARLPALLGLLPWCVHTKRVAKHLHLIEMRVVAVHAVRQANSAVYCQQ